MNEPEGVIQALVNIDVLQLCFVQSGEASQAPDDLDDSRRSVFDNAARALFMGFTQDWLIAQACDSTGGKE